MPVEAVMSTRRAVSAGFAAGSFRLCAKLTAKQSWSVIRIEIRLLADILALRRVQPHCVIDAAKIVFHRLKLFILGELTLGVVKAMQPPVDIAEAEMGKHVHGFIADGLL